MIVPGPAPDKDIWIDTYRPDIFRDEDVVFWKKFQDQVKSSPVEVFVNGVFSDIDSIIAENSRYGGGGFHYMFWFRSIADRDRFVEELENIDEDWKKAAKSIWYFGDVWQEWTDPDGKLDSDGNVVKYRYHLRGNVVPETV